MHIPAKAGGIYMSFTGKCCSAAFAAMALAAEASWDPGEPVITYWHGPGGCRHGQDYVPLTDFWAKQLKEGGFNTVWTTRPEELDLAARYGFRAICDYRNERTIHVKAPRPAERLDPSTRKWTSAGKEFDLVLPRGGGFLLRLAAQ